MKKVIKIKKEILNLDKIITKSNIVIIQIGKFLVEL
jgi:hypothetical protein